MIEILDLVLTNLNLCSSQNRLELNSSSKSPAGQITAIVQR